ncbi:thymidine phosphorylase [Adhaeretor mobilis]|uniref:thymidine phosphorylase n=1 Tax=Adhaeretor mobilis TaxID=1930276 RepID=A0A517MV65_9BACT|nr:thymidine phosphorylase [Adhaeretor mobilis]QDS98677.1 Pyrimidine-nucleoside phosphorylase [Adhaeretor mobilis]
MNPVWIIEKKRDKGHLSQEEIAYFIAGFADETIPDYQMASLAMAIYLNGMTTEETANLTQEMLASGATFKWSGDAKQVDKHSSGGIGDKVSLPLAAMLACCDLQVPMISGRGLGSTGGTLDKLESIGGFRTNLSMDEMRQVVEKVGCVISGATPELVPADRKLYALRDVIGTVPSIPLITGSIMSKKLAEGLDALVLDVKYGSGAFMKSLSQARQLAQSLVDTGKRMGVATTALVTDMNQPLGRMVGNAVEVDESVAALEGEGPSDLMEVTLALGAELLVSTGTARDVTAARKQLQQTIDSGGAREKFAEMVTIQGGDLEAPRVVAPPNDLVGKTAGYVSQINSEQLGQAIISLGGGRKKQGEALDHSTGLEMLVRLGEQVKADQPLVRVFAKGSAVDDVRMAVLDAIEISEEPVKRNPLIVERFE